MPTTPRVAPIWSTVIGATLGALPVTWLGWHLVLTYWRIYHLDGPGVGLFLIYIGLPAGLALSWAAIVLASQAVGRRGRSYSQSLASGMGIAMALWIFLLVVEIRRTREDRSGEGAGAGDLAPYLLHHLR